MRTKCPTFLQWKRRQWNRISPLSLVLVDGAGICLSAKFSRHLGQRQLPSPVLAQSRAPAISQGRIRKQTKQKGNMSSWVLIIEILTAVIIETYYVCILFLILTNQWRLKDIFDNVIFRSLQGLPMLFRGKAKVWQDHAETLPVWYHLLPSLPVHLTRGTGHLY